MSAPCQSLTIDQGSTFIQPLRVRHEDKSYRDFTGYTARMHIRAGIDAADPLIELTTENGRILIEETFIRLKISSADTTQLEPTDGLVYDLEIISPDEEVERLLQGQVYISREVTR